jgi:hypothetical protein
MVFDSNAEEMVKRPEVLHHEFRCRAEIVWRRSTVLEAVRMISSTQRNMYTVSAPRRKMNNEVSALASTNLRESR